MVHRTVLHFSREGYMAARGMEVRGSGNFHGRRAVKTLIRVPEESQESVSSRNSKEK